LQAAAGLALAPQLGCQSGPKAVLPLPADGYPLLEVAGSHRQIGRMIGKAMKDRIGGYLQVAREFPTCLAYLQGEGRETLDRMLARAQAAFPQLVEELQGMAEGLEMPFLDLFAHTCRSEIDVLTDPPGCSTLVLCDGERMILAHNEDGNDLNIGRMFLVKVTPPSGITFLTFVYPGLLPGNGPGFNSAGIVQTTNYIQPRRVADGVPRYFIARAVLEARSLGEAVRMATTKPRAFPWHHNLASLSEQRALSLETVADPEPRHDLLEVEGFYIHTNHLLHPTLSGEGRASPAPYDVPYESSLTRLEVLRRTQANEGPPADAAGMLRMLSLHEGRPYSPCRHPEGEVHGATLGTALFTSPARTMTLYHGNPCRNLKKDHPLPG
jgi:hypothetical protein